MQVSQQRGEYVSPSAGRITVGSLATEWLESKEATTRDSHYRMLESAWRVHVKPVWGDVPVNRIDRLSVERWVAKLTADGSGATTVRRCLGVLAGVLDDAVRGGYVAVNRARGVDGVPRKSPKRRIYLTAQDVARLAEQAGRHRLLVLLLAYTGLRWSEAVSLRASSVDSDRGRISVHEGAVQLGTGYQVSTPKHDKVRSVPVPEFLLIELVKLCVDRSQDALLFPGDDGGYLSRPKQDGWLDGACRRAKVPRITAHQLRHSYASLAVSAGANVLALARALGHDDPSVTLRTYADLFDSDLDAVAESLNRLAATTAI